MQVDHAVAETPFVEQLELHANIVRKGRLATSHQNSVEEQVALVDQAGLDRLGGKAAGRHTRVNGPPKSGSDSSKKDTKAFGHPRLQLRRKMPELTADQIRRDRHQAVQLQGGWDSKARRIESGLARIQDEVGAEEAAWNVAGDKSQDHVTVRPQRIC
jgi:hypothetical protein